MFALTAEMIFSCAHKQFALFRNKFFHDEDRKNETCHQKIRVYCALIFFHPHLHVMYDGIERGELNPTEYKCNLYYKNLCPCQTLKTLKSDVGLFLSTPSMSRTQYLSKEAKVPSFYCFWLCN